MPNIKIDTNILNNNIVELISYVAKDISKSEIRRLIKSNGVKINNQTIDNEKLIIISRASDKIKIIIEEIIDKKVEDIKFILSAGILEKKSKLRALFEKNINTICIPFYADNHAYFPAETMHHF